LPFPIPVGIGSVGWDNQGFPLCFEHASGDLDAVRELPYRPAAVFLPRQRPDR
jgi:hypothetical protein